MRQVLKGRIGGLIIAVTLAGCAAAGDDTGGGGGSRDAGPGGGRDVGPGGGFDSGIPPGTDGGPPPVTPDPEAFWEDDPPPRECYPDGGMGPLPDPPGGTPECPDDRNRQGCRCSPVGMMAPCWPGHRVDRMRGICRDGTTTCEPYDEFTGVWGECRGYVLPMEGALRGPGACNCFSAGRWAIDNLSPCFITYGGAGGGTYAVSTYVSGGSARCPDDPGGPPPNPQPGTNWSTNSLTVDCEGLFTLCYTLKAGDADAPAASDCVVSRVCTGPTWYMTAGATQTLDPLPSWTGTDSACAGRFATSGGYGEMSVIGFSRECDAVDDGMGGEYVFNRVNYCPLSCSMTPTAPECVGCMMGGSGMF